MKKKITLLLLISILSNEITQAQSKFLSGKAITINEKSHNSYYQNDSKLTQKIKETEQNQNSISKNIISYHKNIENWYPDKKDNSIKKINYGILVGVPISPLSQGYFRASVYRHTTDIEKSNSASFFNSIIYHSWSRKGITESEIDYMSGDYNYKWKKLIINPIGLQFKTNSKNFIPYANLGLGVGVIISTNQIIENYKISDDEINFFYGLNLSVSFGFKVKVSSNYILIEYTPTGQGSFLNFGYSF